MAYSANIAISSVLVFLGSVLFIVGLYPIQWWPRVELEAVENWDGLLGLNAPRKTQENMTDEESKNQLLQIARKMNLLIML